ncbi:MULTISPECIES: choice-of-anchor M domain-containing protein [unclassified Actinomyces]|uniref:choice-of-anchor M domain-containing protein n=1 Tax=unclassified Actinomyces TaxID=2609248 RepID=UPI002017A892|nr:MULTISPECIES: choice-of-anchor M domain-containing protein [unclassified Actinomyces]MCL3777471.1 TIGR03769 domain-containing protein [Actinomyces sp. AC-20-1]MCL3790715.1 TIGR03769 domain-containing protein [Actinomyces sp. 187325]MCL3793011.1 TIGR03769 domain-containing protein [Actinomyces sp. 186855]MCL3795448.1 TIGR03769 domain-containing protein [Actinomyces sp. 217892]
MTHLPHARRAAHLAAGALLALGLAAPALPVPVLTAPALAAPATTSQGPATTALGAARPATTTSTAEAQDPDLQQTVTSGESIGQGAAVIDVGHVDLGPRYADGQWRVMMRDDSGPSPVWRDPGEVVLRVRDTALLPAPTDEAYAFMGAEEGQQWYVIPQTQAADVVWLGWNTQDPGVVSAVDRGVTMTIGPVEGPGRSWMFTQSGTFGEPLLLVDGQKHEPQDVWVDANTHVHANWVFTEPGVYTARLSFSATTPEGTELTGSTLLRFAVGDATSTDEALAAPAPDAEGAAQDGTAGSADSADGAAQADSAGSADSADAPAEAGTRRTGLSTGALWLGVALAAVGALGALLARRSRAVAREQHEARQWADAQDSLSPETDAEPQTEEAPRDGDE